MTYTSVGVAEQPDALPQLRLAQTVSGDFFGVLEVEPRLGADISAKRIAFPAATAVAVLAYQMCGTALLFSGPEDCWPHRFG